jgi:DNA-binding LacI/PurR family transcriptional regulator
MITLKEIAEKTGVSLMAVSKALHDAPDISEKTKKKIQAVARSMGYTPNQLARNFRSKVTYTVGALIPAITHPFFYEIIFGLEQVLNKSGYQLVLALSGNESDREQAHIENMVGHRIDGLVVAHTFLNPKLKTLYSQLKKRKYPVVFIDRVPNINLGFPSVTTDDVKGVAQLVRHLLKLGHRRFAYVSGPQGSSTADIRRQTVLKELGSAGLKPTQIVEVGYGLEDGRAAGNALLQHRKEFPTAIIVFSDPVAVGLIQQLSEHGVLLPQYVSVAGYGGISIGAYCRVPLTTIYQPTIKMGQQAGEMLLQILAGKKVTSQVLPVSLQVRDSTASPRKS